MNYKKALYITCLVVVILEVLFLKVMRLGHGYFEFEELPAFGAGRSFRDSLYHHCC